MDHGQHGYKTINGSPELRDGSAQSDDVTCRRRSTASRGITTSRRSGLRPAPGCAAQPSVGPSPPRSTLATVLCEAHLFARRDINALWRAVMPSLDHESLILLFRNQPELAATAARGDSRRAACVHGGVACIVRPDRGHSDHFAPTPWCCWVDESQCWRRHRRGPARARRAQALQLAHVRLGPGFPPRVPGRAAGRHSPNALSPPGLG